MKFTLSFLILALAIFTCKCEDEPTAFEAATPPPNSAEIQSFINSDNEKIVYDPKKCLLDPPPSLAEHTAFQTWAQQHKKTYKTPERATCALVKVVYHMREIEEHNEKFAAGLVTFKRDLTYYSDLSHDEKDEKLLLKGIEDVTYERQAPSRLPVLPPAREYVNYLEEGLVTTDVGIQLKCGSCYAWSGAVALEGQLRKCKISNESVSVQMMVNCPTVGVWGCSSGWPFWVYKWQNLGGILPASKYPYMDRVTNCTYNKDDIIAYAHNAFKWDFTAVNGNSSFIKQVVSAIGPVATIICVERSLYQYSSGVYKNPTCCKAIKHAVGIVGYGTDPEHGDYWLIKNSWGSWWGQNGFGKISRGDNTCITETQIQYAQLRDVNGKVCPFY